MPSTPTPPDPLDPLLNRWKEDPTAMPDLTREVWRRIALEERAKAHAPGFLFQLENWFARPPFAWLFLTSCILLGLFFAEVRLNRLHHERSAQLARNYMRLIDPLLNETSTAPRP